VTCVAELELVRRAREHADRLAIVAPDGRFTYRDLLDGSAAIASMLLGGQPASAPSSLRPDLGEARVALACPAGFAYVAAQWGIWRAGGVAVPLSAAQAPAEWEYIISDSGASLVVAAPDFAAALESVAARVGARVVVPAPSPLAAPPAALPRFPALVPTRRAMILYTSGTTSRPKGVVTSHANLEAQVRALIDAWEWSPADCILNVLPLNHVHGIVNVLSCALWAGATCEMLPRFEAAEVWRRLGAGGLTLFMAVPTIYTRLIGAWERAAPDERRVMSEGAARLRLMVSGSAALPAAILARWRAITGQVLLERYGMTEIGMALSNPLHGERRAGSVGVPLAGVTVRLVDEAGRNVPPGTAGEIEVQGPSVFLEYWNRPEATREAFRDGWFRTGDVAVFEDGMYRILGRSSVDIIKTGGYKVSALEIEDVIRDHPDIRDCAVVGVEDAEWGERVSAAVVLRAGRSLDRDALDGWLRERLARYKVPTRLVVVSDLPRNAMGKVTKAAVRRLFADAGSREQGAGSR
jgi:malonyl-CoA/methylmalonyl-CoA synthetase